MVKKKHILILICFISALLIVMAVGAGIFVYKNRSNSNIVNVFDEMIENGHTAMKDAEHVTAGGYDAIRMLWTVKVGTPLRIGIIYSMKYKKLYIYGDASMPEEIQNMSYQEYFEECLKEYGITWEEVEDSKEDFICKNILGTWFTEYESGYTKDRLGELEVLDFLMPYEYCGKDNSEWITVTETVEEGYRGTFNGKVQYTIWDTGDFLCRQTQKSRDYGYHDIMERIEADINGFNTMSEDIKAEWYCKWHRQYEDEQEYDSLADVLNCSEFLDWLQAGGEVEGNLTKLAYTREEGEEKTREMLEQCSGSKLYRNLQTADYYIAGNELNIRLAYYDYKTENSDWVDNGKGELWQGWITIKIDYIREFFDAEGFYIERPKNWDVSVTDGLGYLYKRYAYYYYLEKYYHVLEYSITTAPRDDYYSTVLKEYLKEDNELSEKIRDEHPGESPLMIDYHLFDFNDDDIEDYLVCMHQSKWSRLDENWVNVNMVRIYIQEKNGTLRCVFEDYIHLHDRDTKYSHVPMTVLEEKTGGYYILALPESEIILEYNEESGKYEYYERED
ncbi:MAG: TipC family immunity protein [Lachnospiraceae bacterium]|nr:TipC family immunity protein [Lachnospiraceae bacterium]